MLEQETLEELIEQLSPVWDLSDAYEALLREDPWDSPAEVFLLSIAERAADSSIDCERAYAKFGKLLDKELQDLQDAYDSL